jgi:NADPH:quinone reductase-like Zn-dependent oxidoreductase
VPGIDVAGWIVAVGPGVTTLKTQVHRGERVLITGGAGRARARREGHRHRLGAAYRVSQEHRRHRRDRLSPLGLGTFTSVGSHDYTAARCAESGITCPPGGSVLGGPVSIGTLLREAVQLVNAGQLKVHIDKSYPLAEAAAAQQFNREGHTEGKVILAIHDADHS